MAKILERNVAELIIVSLILLVFLTSCGTAKKIQEEPMKECCKKTAQAVYEYEGWVVSDCENCDEVD